MRTTAVDRIRKEIAHEAAKLVALEGIEDYLMAKRKAAQQLGINNKKVLPTNNEIELALIEYQSLFNSEEHRRTLEQFRQMALKTMNLLEQFSPRLVGHVLSGSAGQHSEITIHLYCDTPEYVSLYLEQHDIPVTICERRIKTTINQHEYFTAYKFIAGNANIVLLILPELYLKKPPFDPVTGRPMKRANINKVKNLLR